MKEENELWHLNSKGLYVKKNEDMPTYWYLNPEDAKDVKYYDLDDPQEVKRMREAANKILAEIALDIQLIDKAKEMRKNLTKNDQNTE